MRIIRYTYFIFHIILFFKRVKKQISYTHQIKLVFTVKKNSDFFSPWGKKGSDIMNSNSNVYSGQIQTFFASDLIFFLSLNYILNNNN